MVISFDGLRFIRRAKLARVDRDVLDAIFERLDGNIVAAIRMRDLAADVGVGPTALSRSISNLERAGIVQRGDVRGVVILNPHIGFRGSPARQVAAVAEWDRAHRPQAVPSQQRLA